MKTLLKIKKSLLSKVLFLPVVKDKSISINLRIEESILVKLSIKRFTFWCNLFFTFIHANKKNWAIKANLFRGFCRGFAWREKSVVMIIGHFFFRKNRLSNLRFFSRDAKECKRLKKILHYGFITSIKQKILIFSLLFACTLEPEYKTPESPVEFQKSDQIPEIKWEDFFENPEIKNIIKTALENNRDLKIAFLNIESAKANYMVQRSYLLPSINATGTERKYSPSNLVYPTYEVGIGVTSYEFDLFGRLRSLKKAAQENILANTEAKNTVKLALISETAGTYLQVLTNMEILKILEKTVELKEENHKLLEQQFKFGLISNVELLQSSINLENSKFSKEAAISALNQSKNALTLLIGTSKYEISENFSIKNIKINENLLGSTPSEALLLRPDIKQAERNLKIANANIGAARAAFFPSITLTSSLGYSSNSLGNLFSNSFWLFSPSINVPIFTWGRNKGNLDYAEIQKDINIAQYEKAIQNAFREVLDALTTRESIQNQLKYSQEITSLSEKSLELANLQFKDGLTSKTSEINSELSLLTAKQNETITLNNYLTSLITLYKTFGNAE